MCVEPLHMGTNESVHPYTCVLIAGCGVIPTKLTSRADWGTVYIGDSEYFSRLASDVPRTCFVQHVTYVPLRWVWWQVARGHARRASGPLAGAPAHTGKTAQTPYATVVQRKFVDQDESDLCSKNVVNM